MEQKQYKDYGAAWIQSNEWGESISVSLNATLLHEFPALNGKIKIVLKANTRKTEPKHPDFRVSPPKGANFNAYKEQLPQPKPQPQEMDVPASWEPAVTDDSCPF